MTTPAAETRSIGLLAFAPLSWFLHRHLDNLIMTWQIRTLYRDYAIWTVPSGRENSRPSTGTLQKLMPAPTQTATHHTTGPLGVRVLQQPSPSSVENLSWQLNFQWSSKPWLLTYQISSWHNNFHPFTGTLPSWQFHHDMTIPARLPGL
jgi:hypothetical protein